MRQGRSCHLRYIPSPRRRRFARSQNGQCSHSRTLNKFSSLKGAGLVRSKRGVGGGYVLARDAGDIQLSEIVRAVDGPITAGDFGEPHTDEACNHEGQCVLLTIWGAAGAHMREFLDSFSLADIAEMAKGESPWPS